MKYIKNKVFESKLSEFNEVKTHIQEWFDGVQEDAIEIIPARLTYDAYANCPECGWSELSKDYDYDTGMTNYECNNCETALYNNDFQHGLKMNVAYPTEDKMNCYFVVSKETNKRLLDYLSNEKLNHLAMYLENLDYSPFRFESHPSEFRIQNTVILANDDLEKCLKCLQDTDQECFYPINQIKESKLVTSYDIQEFLYKYWGENRVIAFLASLSEDENATNTINFLQPKEGDLVYFSPDSKYPNVEWNRFDWNKQKLEAQAGKIGRIAKSLIPKDKLITDREIEEFVNIWKSHFIGSRFKMEEVRGEEIRKWYSGKNHNILAKKASLGVSCMSGSPERFFNLYVDNPEVISIILLKDEDDKLLARALVWQSKSQSGKNIPILDRIYYTQDWNKNDVFRFFKEKYPNGLKASEIGGYRHIVQLKSWKYTETGYPYLDTFSILNWKTGELSNLRPSNDSWCIKLQSTGGGWSDSLDIVYSEVLKDFLLRSDAFFNREKESWMPMNKIQKIRRKIKLWTDF